MNKESNIGEPQHGLRSRDALRPSSRYEQQDQLRIQGPGVVEKVKTLKRKRADKEGL